MSVKAKIRYFLIFGLFSFITYFSIQSVITTHEFNFLTSLDTSIPFVPSFIWIYHSLIPGIAVSMILLLKRKNVFLTTFFSLILATTILGLFHILLPSFYPRDGISVSDISTWLVALTRSIDGAHNTFPSAHVSFSWILVFATHDSVFAKRCKWAKTAYIIWASLISISTLTLKQHYIIDVASGFVLAYICYFLIQRLTTNLLKENTNYIKPPEELQEYGSGI